MFFHAEIQGAPATVLKKGEGASEQDKLEVAQFAASFSSAWKREFSAIDVYAVPRSSVSKSAKSGEYLAKGGFIISGKREWFRSTPLGLFVGFNSEGKMVVVPNSLSDTLVKGVSITPGDKKLVAAKAVKALMLDKAGKEQLMQIIP